MIQWIYGASGAGKTTMARRLATPGAILLDGDDMRRVWTDLGFSDEDRRINNMRIANLARVLDRQGFNVVVATICPFDDLRAEIKALTGCVFIHIEGMEDSKQWSS